MIRYLAIEEIIFLHDLALRETGGASGIRDLSLLHSAAERPKLQFGGTDLYLTLEAKAGALTHALVLNHPFVDGNKRAAAAALIRFLEMNHYPHRITNEKLFRLMLRVARRRVSPLQLARWVRAQRKQT